MMSTVYLDLPHPPRDIAVLPSGEILVWSWTGAGHKVDLYDDDLTLLWGLELGNDALGMSIDRCGVPWILDRRGISALTSEGDVWHRVNFAPPEGMDVCASTTVDEDVIFACQHADAAEACEPLLARVAADGTVRWLTVLSSDLVDFNGHPDSSGCSPEPGTVDRPQVPSDWLNGYLGAGRLILSGDALFARYTEVRQSPFGLGYVVGVADGILRYTATVAAGNSTDVTGMADGAFLVGCMGQTTLYDREGRQRVQWKTAGVHVVRPGDIRVLEYNGGFQSRIARLLPDGSVIRGDLIDGYHTTEAYIRDDGTVIFVRNGLLTKVQDLLIVARRFLAPFGAHDIMSTRVLPVADGLVTTYSQFLRGDSRGHQSGLLRIEF
jgi:hypothetical protein